MSHEPSPPEALAICMLVHASCCGDPRSAEQRKFQKVNTKNVLYREAKATRKKEEEESQSIF
jgi:hypothetical protein